MAVRFRHALLEKGKDDMTAKKQTYKGSKDWDQLNQDLMRCKNVGQLEEMLDKEKSGKNRAGFLFRIHSRLNKVRADIERALLRGGK